MTTEMYVLSKPQHDLRMKRSHNTTVCKRLVREDETEVCVK